MQVKPRFENSKILKQYPLVIDDTNNEMCLTLLEAKLPSDSYEIMETPYQYWCVIGKNQTQYANKAISYSSIAFWKTNKKDKLFKQNVNGFLVEEIEDGHHRIFGENMFFCSPEKYGLRTKFKITKVLTTDTK